MKMNLQGVLKNKFVLYAVSTLAVINVLGYLSIGSMECLGVFALAALVCQQYTKNMTVCLLGAIFAANVIFGCGRIKENFEGLMEGAGAAAGSVDPEALAGAAKGSATAAAMDAGLNEDDANVVGDAAAAGTKAACNKAKGTWTDGENDEPGSCASA
jgi:hypothetical protein